jgi:hypothetical protein
MILIALYVTVLLLLCVIAWLCSRLAEARRDREGWEQEERRRSSGAKLIEIERWRQMTEEGWTAEHDDREHGNGELADAAACYAISDWESPYFTNVRKNLWPWQKAWWKPSSDRVRNLVKAGALIAAEIERLQRVDARKATEQPAVVEKEAA